MGAATHRTSEGGCEHRRGTREGVLHSIIKLGHPSNRVTLCDREKPGDPQDGLIYRCFGRGNTYLAVTPPMHTSKSISNVLSPHPPRKFLPNIQMGFRFLRVVSWVNQGTHLVKLTLLLLQRAQKLLLLPQVHCSIVQFLLQPPPSSLQPLYCLCLFCQALGQGLRLPGCAAPSLLPSLQRPSLFLLASPPFRELQGREGCGSHSWE